jgi:hypothetical protein
MDNTTLCIAVSRVALVDMAGSGIGIASCHVSNAVSYSADTVTPHTSQITRRYGRVLKLVWRDAREFTVVKLDSSIFHTARYSMMCCDALKFMVSTLL